MRNRLLVTAVVTLTMLGLAGCAGSESHNSTVPAAAPAAPGAVQDNGAEVGSAAAKGKPVRAADVAGGSPLKAEASADGGENTVVAKPQVIRTAEVVVEVEVLATAAARVRSVAESLGGSVSSEVTTYPEAGSVPGGAPRTSGGEKPGGEKGTDVRSTYSARPGESVIVLRVPVSSLDQAIDRVAATGKQLSRSSTAQDVTADLADIGSRVKTQQASVERVRALMAKATALQDVVMLEAELSRRQADLEALQARQASLTDRAALSTLTVTLRTPQASRIEDDGDDPVLVKGLKQGWKALGASAAVLLTLLGALFPFAVLGAVVGLPVWRLLRRRRQQGPRPGGPQASPRPAPGDTAQDAGPGPAPLTGDRS